MPNFLVLNMSELAKSFSREDAKKIAESYGFVVTEPTVAPVAIVTWEKIADEYGTFVLTTTSTVRYGAVTRGGVPAWTERTLPPGTYTANNATFGGDPIKGIVKRVEIKKFLGSDSASLPAITLAADKPVSVSLVVGNAVATRNLHEIATLENALPSGETWQEQPLDISIVSSDSTNILEIVNVKD